MGHQGGHGLCRAGAVLLKGITAATLTDSDFAFGQPNILQDAIGAFYAGWVSQA